MHNSNATPEVDDYWSGVKAAALGAWPNASTVDRQALFAMHEALGSTSVLTLLDTVPVSHAAPTTRSRKLLLSELEGEAAYSDMVIHRLSGSGEFWRRAVFVGPEGFGAVQ